MHRSGVKAPELTGALIVALGAAVATGWFSDLRPLAALVPSTTRMGIVNPLLFMAFGLALIAASRPGTAGGGRRAVVAVAAVLLAALPIGYLIENFAGVSLGIDVARPGARPTSANPHPGRISPNASIGFLALGLALALHGLPGRLLSAPRRAALLLCCATVTLIGVGGMVGHFLGLQSLYRFIHFNGMLPGTAMGLSLAAAGLWTLTQATRQEAPIGQASARTIQWRSLTVIGLVALGAGVAGFGTMRLTYEQSVSQGLLLTASTNAKALANAIDLTLRYSRATAARPPLRQALHTLSTAPGNADARATLRQLAPTLLPLGDGALEIYDADGLLVARAGRADRPPAPLGYTLPTTGPRSTLLWRGSYLLATDMDIAVDGRTVGRLVIELPLTFFDTILADLRSSGEATDATIIGRVGNRALVAPSKANAAPLELLLLDSRAQPARPELNALAGQQGVDIRRDTTGAAVMTAHVPIGAYGVALTVETGVAGLYGALRERLQVLALSLAAIVGIAFYAQRNQVRPLLRQLVGSQQRLQRILEAQTELISLATPDGRLSYVNPAYARQFACTPAAMIGANLFDHVEPADRAGVRARFADLVAGGTPLVSENRMLSAEGREMWVAWVNTVEPDADGRPTIHSVGRDITARKHAEIALSTAQAFLARTGRVAGIGGWEVDLPTGQVVWSDETRRIHGVDDDFVPTLANALAFYAPAARPLIEAAVARAGRDGTPWDLELPLVTARGRAIWVRVQGEAEWEDGALRRLVGAFQDITERRLLQERLSASENFIRKITDSLPVRIAYVDTALRYAFVNHLHCQRFGLDREQIVGRTRSELIGAPLDKAVRERLEAALAGHEQRYEFDERVGDRLVRIESRLIPDVDADGSVRGLFATGIDITERSRSERALRELALIFDNTPDFVVQADHHGALCYLNPSVRRALGLAADAPIAGLRFDAFNTPETNRRFADEIVPAVKAQGVWLGQTTVMVQGNRALPVSHMVIAHRDEQGRVARYSAIMRDISTAVAAAEQVSRQTATLHSISEAIPAIVAVVGADGRYRFVNGAFERWYGAPRDQVIGRSVMEVLGLKEYERSRPFIERVLHGESVSFEKHYADAGGDRHLGVSYIPLRLDGGGVDGFVGVANDITQHKREELRLVKLSQHDPLTGLLNRAGFEYFLDDHTAQPARQADGQVALLYLDLDHFKPVNDTHGHAVGDQLLQAFAKRLLRVVRPTDAVARLGGDEFAVALIGVREHANANAVAEKLLNAAAEPFRIGGLTLHVGTSIGVAFGIDPAQGWRELVERADARLYEAKAAGRGRFSSSRHHGAKDSLG